MPFGLWKKPWEKAQCTFTLQEYASGSSRGWSDVTEATGTIPTKAEALEHFKPGKHYRVLARYVEGDRAGQLAGVVWSHYEKAPGGLTPVPKEKAAKSDKPKDVADMLGEYVEQVEHTLQPIVKFSKAMEEIRDSLFPEAARMPMREGSEEGSYGIPPLEYDGKAPWFMHPYIAHTIAEEAKSVIEFAASRFEQVLKGPGIEAVTETEEEPRLPSLDRFVSKKPPETPPVEEEKPLLPALAESTPEEMQLEAEAVPSLIVEEGEAEGEEGVLPTPSETPIGKDAAQADTEPQKGRSRRKKSDGK